MFHVFVDACGGVRACTGRFGTSTHKLSEQTSRTGNNRSHPLVLQELHEEPSESEFIFARAFGKSVSIFEPSHGAMTSLSGV